nr:DUF1515 family protein [Phyllobacterium myrsinacearum]
MRRDMDASDRRAGAETREVDEKQAVVHRRMDGLIEKVSGIKIHMASISAKIDDSKKIRDEMKKVDGDRGLVGLAGTALGVTLANSVEWLARPFHRRGPAIVNGGRISPGLMLTLESDNNPNVGTWYDNFKKQQSDTLNPICERV